MVKKNFLFGESAQNAIIKGIKTVSDAVGSTFGANGENVLIEHMYEGISVPKSTKDGVSVARECTLMDPSENLAAQALIEVAMRMLERVGDGTTTAILVTEALINLMLKYDLKRTDIDKLRSHVTELVELFKTHSIKVEDVPEILEGIANISCNGEPEITSNMKKAISHIGKTGEILVEIHQALQTSVMPERGVYIPYGFATHEVIINQQRRHTAEFKDVFLVLYDGRIESFIPMMYLIENVIEQEPHTPIVFIASHISDEAQIGITANSMGNIRMSGISLDQDNKTMDDLFTDISAATGVPIFGEKYNKIFGTTFNGIVFNKKQRDLKKVSSIRLSKNSTIILPYEDQQSGLEAHVSDLNEKLESVFDETERNVLKSRIARLAPTLAIVRIGGLTTQTILEKKDRYEDACCAVKQTIEHGAVPGAGIPILMAIKHLWDKTRGLEEDDYSAEILIRALFKVLVRLYAFSAWEMKNERIDFEEYTHVKTDEFGEIKEYMDKVKNFSFEKMEEWKGLDLSTDKVVNLFTHRIFDPVTVITTALETGVEAALNMMKTGTIITRSRKLDMASTMSMLQHQQ